MMNIIVPLVQACFTCFIFIDFIFNTVKFMGDTRFYGNVLGFSGTIVPRNLNKKD